MAYKLSITQDAHKDLEEIIAYLTKQLENPSAAKKFFHEVEAVYTQLEMFPFLYELCRDERLSARGYRKAVVGNYIIIFRPSEADETVYILRIFYGRRQYETLL